MFKKWINKLFNTGSAETSQAGSTKSGSTKRSPFKIYKLLYWCYASSIKPHSETYLSLIIFEISLIGLAYFLLLLHPKHRFLNLGSLFNT